MQQLWYQIVKVFVKIALHFYTQKIKVKGIKNIPNKGAILLVANHPNALLDPLYIAITNPRSTHFLVRADVFKKPLLKKIFASVNMMPIYRIRDGRSSLTQNEYIFKKCYEILEKEQCLLIFPQGGHSRERTVQPLSKGFTRIVFGALQANKNLDLKILPVGLTYQNSSKYPAKIAIQFGKPIDAKQFDYESNINLATENLKVEVSKQLQQLSVHLPKNENSEQTLQQLNKANIDFTEVEKTNQLIRENKIVEPNPKKTNLLFWMKLIIITNSLAPYLVWKINQKKIKEVEFIDTFRFGLFLVLLPFYYALQAFLVLLFLGKIACLFYLICSFLMLLAYTKLSPTNAE